MLREADAFSKWYCKKINVPVVHLCISVFIRGSNAFPELKTILKASAASKDYRQTLLHNR
jgi:hypothetical protein